MAGLNLVAPNTDATRGRNTVLAALRLYQENCMHIPERIRDVATDDGTSEALTPAEIDVLCTEINF